MLLSSASEYVVMVLCDPVSARRRSFPEGKEEIADYHLCVRRLAVRRLYERCASGTEASYRRKLLY
jgi:hypothetical protein